MTSRPTHAAEPKFALDLARALEAERQDVMRSNDAERSAEIFAPELRFIHSSGGIDTRDELVEKYRNKVHVYRTVSLDVHDARALTPDLLWLSGRLRLEVLSAGQERVVLAIYSAIWTRHADTWRLAVHQSTGVSSFA